MSSKSHDSISICFYRYVAKFHLLLHGYVYCLHKSLLYFFLPFDLKSVIMFMAHFNLQNSEQGTKIMQCNIIYVCTIYQSMSNLFPTARLPQLGHLVRSTCSSPCVFYAKQYEVTYILI